MNDYLQALSRRLGGLDPIEREDILADYREHFEIGLSQGKTEKQIASELGEPESIAKMYTALNATSKAGMTKSPKDAFRMVGAAFAYQVGKGIAIGTLYTAFILCIVPIFLLGPTLCLGAVGLVFLSVIEFIKGFLGYGFLAISTGAMLFALGGLCILGTRQIWIITIGALSAMTRRWLGNDREGVERV